MKSKLISFAAVLVMVTNSSMAATTITVASLGASSLLVTNSSGTVYSGGSWGVGVFAPGTDFSGEPSTLLSAFNQAGNTAAFSAFPGVFGAAGGAVVTANLPTTVTGPFVGNPMFVIVGNAPTLAGSTDFIVTNSGVNFTQEVEGVGGNISALFKNGTVLRGIGTTVNGGSGPTAGQNGQPGITFGVIPEPSAALLGALGALGLLRRRRI